MSVRVLLVLSVLAVLYGCGQASSPAERQEQPAGTEKATAEATTPSGSGTTVGPVFAKVDLEPVGDSSTHGTAVFKKVGDLGVQVELAPGAYPSLEPATSHRFMRAPAPEPESRKRAASTATNRPGIMTTTMAGSVPPWR